MLRQGQTVETKGWLARRGTHRLLIVGGERLIGLLVKSGGIAKKGEPGVFHHPLLPGLELRVGGTNQQGKIKQIQSVGAPCLGEDGRPRIWLPSRDLVELPEASYHGSNNAREHYGNKADRSGGAASKGPANDTTRSGRLRTARLPSRPGLTEPQALKS
jgi:hypothetical protein